MRLFIYLFVAGFSLHAQTDTSSVFWRDLKDYLELPDEQLAAVLTELTRGEEPFWEQDSRLKFEIREETARSPLRPQELGRLHVDWELARRQFRERDRMRRAAARAVLNETQLIKMNALDELSKRVRVLQKTTWIGLTLPDCDAPESRGDTRCQSPYIPSVGQIPNVPGLLIYAGDDEITLDLLYPGIRAYLGLPASQMAQLVENSKRYPSETTISRMRTVTEEIRQEMLREVLDPPAIGQRYAEVEALRRKLTGDARALVLANAGILSEQQRTKLNALGEAVRLHPIAAVAREIGVLESRCREVYSVSAEEEFPFIAYAGDCPDKRALEELPK